MASGGAWTHPLLLPCMVDTPFESVGIAAMMYSRDQQCVAKQCKFYLSASMLLFNFRKRKTSLDVNGNVV